MSTVLEPQANSDLVKPSPTNFKGLCVTAPVYAQKLKREVEEISETNRLLRMKHHSSLKSSEQFSEAKKIDAKRKREEKKDGMTRLWSLRKM